jgi:hypothetical protein
VRHDCRGEAGVRDRDRKVPIAKILPTKVIPTAPRRLQGQDHRGVRPHRGCHRSAHGSSADGGNLFQLDGHRRIAALNKRGAKEGENAKAVKYLAAKHADLLTEFQRIQEAASLET